MAGLSLRRNFAWTLVGNVVYAVCLWGQLALLTKLGTTGTVGRFALASAVATPVIMFAQLQLRSVLASDARGQFVFRDYFGVRLVLLPPALLVVLAVGLLAYNPAQTVIIMLFALGRAIESVSDMLYGYQQQQERLDLVAISMMIKGSVALLAFGAVFVLTDSLAWGLTANAAAWLMPLFAFDLPRCRALLRAAGGGSLWPRWRWSTARPMILLALPMGLVMLAIQMRNTVPRTLLEAKRSEAELGVFSALAYLAVAGTTVVLSLSQASLARFGRHHAEGRPDLMRAVLVRMMALGLALGVAGVLVAWVAGRPLLRWLYSAEYAAQTRLLVLIMADGGMMYLASLLGAPATAMRLFRGQLVVQVSSVALLCGLGWLLIPRLGMQGAALTMLGGGVWVTAGYAWLVWRGLRSMDAVAGAASVPRAGRA